MRAVYTFLFFFFPQTLYKLHRFMHLHIFSPVEKMGLVITTLKILFPPPKGFLKRVPPHFTGLRLQLGQRFSVGVVLPCRAYLALWRNFFFFFFLRKRALLGSGEWRPGMLVNILQYIEQQRISQPQM